MGPLKWGRNLTHGSEVTPHESLYLERLTALLVYAESFNLLYSSNSFQFGTFPYTYPYSVLQYIQNLPDLCF